MNLLGIRTVRIEAKISKVRQAEEDLSQKRNRPEMGVSRADMFSTGGNAL